MVKNTKTGQDMIREDDWSDWAPNRIPVGRPAKKDQYGNIIHRKPTSIYLDIRLKDWIQNKSGNLSNWIESMIMKAYEKQYCFHCFDDNVEEKNHGWVCTNELHRRKSGKNAPSIVLKWKMCANCQAWYSENNLPIILSDDIIGCDQCKREENLTSHKDIMSFKPSEKNDAL